MAQSTLANARAMLGWTLDKLARESDTPLSTIADLERGANENPGYQLVMRIVGALQRGGLKGVTAESIFPVVVPAPTKTAKRRGKVA